MVYHNLSMSLNHHVPIFNCTVTRRGGLSLRFRHLSNCKLRVPSATSLAFSTTPHTQQTDGCVWLHSVLQPRPPPPPFRVTSPVLGHVTLLYRLWALWFELHTAVSVCVHYRCSTSRRFTQIRRLRWNHLFSGASFRPFRNMEKLQQIRLNFFPSFTEDQMLFLKLPIIWN